MDKWSGFKVEFAGRPPETQRGSTTRKGVHVMSIISILVIIVLVLLALYLFRRVF